MREQPGAELFATAEVDVDECADLAARDRTVAKPLAEDLVEGGIRRCAGWKLRLLDVSSRTELGGALPGEPNAPLPV